MGILIRFGILAMLGLVGRWRRRNAPPIVKTVSKLSWGAKAQLSWRLVRDKRVPVWARGMTLLPALYLAAPIDLLPDFIPALGRVDDALILGFAIDLLIKFVPATILEEHLDSVSPGGSSAGRS
jgi:uncharacterized membrane protein YkvA (DUF1232 family)